MMWAVSQLGGRVWTLTYNAPPPPNWLTAHIIRLHTQAICHVQLKILDIEISKSIRRCMIYISTLTAYNSFG